jgi:DnaK suppressor protein
LAQTEQKKMLKDLGGENAVRERLEAQRQEILAMYEIDLKAGQAAGDEETDDIVDRANNAYSRELLFSLSDGERNTLIRVEDALVRLNDGAYGVCSHCGRPIGAPRLKAVPSARYCIDCQELAENGMLEES